MVLSDIVYSDVTIALQTVVGELSIIPRGPWRDVLSPPLSDCHYLEIRGSAWDCMALFRRKKSPLQLVQRLTGALVRIISSEGPDPKDIADVAKRLRQINSMLYGEGDKLPNPAECRQLGGLFQSAEHGHVVTLFLRNFQKVPYESRKAFAHAFNNLMKNDWGGFGMKYVSLPEQHGDIVALLIDSYGSMEVRAVSGTQAANASPVQLQAVGGDGASAPAASASDGPANAVPVTGTKGRGLNSTSAVQAAVDMSCIYPCRPRKGPDTLVCGSMLRECVRYPLVTKRVLQSPQFLRFFTQYLRDASFDIMSDAFTTFRDLLSLHKSIVAEYLENNYDQFMDNFNELMRYVPETEKYITRRQAVKLLGEILLDRANFRVMMRYIASRENLILMMVLLRDKSEAIQFEAFHVFKVFVANPQKPRSVESILCRNRDKLIAYLRKFHTNNEARAIWNIYIIALLQNAF